ncbi:Putative stage IV sporulation YqfD [Moorella glycerini]|uniref:Stage IV sporulation protein YqfD n=1 Tax=Neomoorella stamsii TaxID=1266720 RepID=A0A9X7J5T8_9FIRM|nr:MULTISPECIES: sporulation protein YqfD [Moorella]PRR77480.1 putative stage IV sporulation protein YqfD [Moorella stamsii]CEP68229.1 Putative stage IV sporulation YqfD [Moorella glycerini]
MAWRNWLAYLEGYLILTISGDDPEGFLNLALAQGISLWDITRHRNGSIQAKMPAGEYRALRSLARQSRCRVRIVDKRGWPFFSRRLRGRQVLLLGSLFFLLAIYLLSTFIWVVDVRPENGPLRRVTPDQVLAAARAEGLKPGARKSALDTRTLEYALERRLPQLAWVGIRFHGTRAEITVVEKAAPPGEEAVDRPASIIAAKDGVIKDILVINGEGRVKAGDTVRQGEILISGLILPPRPEKKPGEAAAPEQPPPAPRLVRARGIVRARVWYEGEKEINRRQVQEVPTGRQHTTIMVQTPGHRYILKGPQQPPYTSYRQENKVVALPSWRNFTLPVELIITSYYEVQVRYRQLSYEEAVSTAGRQILAELKEKLPPGASITGQKIVPLTKPEDEIVRVRAWVETEEDIGQVVPLSGKQ